MRTIKTYYKKYYYPKNIITKVDSVMSLFNSQEKDK